MEREETTHIHVIEQKFLESGHSFMEADSMHGAIEKEQRHVSINSVLEWMNIMQKARSNRNRRTANPYHVHQLKYPDVLDLKDLSKRLKKKTRHQSLKLAIDGEQHYSKNDTPEDGYGVGSGVTSDPEDELFGEVEDYSSDSYMPSDSNSSESGVEESVCDAGFGKHVTAEDAHTDQVFLEKREVVKKKVFERKKRILERGKGHHIHGKEI
nr:unnamed protein product [Callosobruchus chinensis]